MLGIGNEDHCIVIKPLTKEESLKHDIPSNKKYKITVRSSYSRVSNKAFMEEISVLFSIDFTGEPKKFPTNWDKKERILSVNLRGSIK